MQICKNKIDIHAHSIMSDFPDKVFMTYHSPEELLLKYDMLGIEKGMLLPSVSPEGSKFPITTDHTVEIVNKYPERYFFAIGLDPRMVDNSSDTDFGKILEFYKSKGAKAVGEMTANLNFDDPLYDNMLAQCAEHDLPVTIHISPAIGYSYGVVDDPGLPRLEKMLKKYPKLKIFGHSQAFWAHMSKDVDREIMKGYPKGKVVEGTVVGSVVVTMGVCSVQPAKIRASSANQTINLRFIAYSFQVPFSGIIIPKSRFAVNELPV